MNAGTTETVATAATPDTAPSTIAGGTGTAARSVAQLIGRTLADLGVDRCFGVVGSGNFELVNALRAAGVQYTAARHEGGAATMADAYARVSGKPALLALHQGCGLTNAATGICEAAKARTPLIVLAAESSPEAVHSNFAMDQGAMAHSLLAVSERVHTPASAVADTVRAFRRAVNERRTVVLNLPVSVQEALAPADAPATPAVPPILPLRPAGAAVTQMAELIGAAERPVFIVGRGGLGAGREIRALAEQTGGLLATSAVAKGLFNGEEFDLGISGGFSSPLAAELISNADLIVGFGCALNMWTMRHGRLIGPGTRIIQVDLDDAALGAHRPVDLGVQGDCGATALDVLAELRTRYPEPRTGYRTPEVAKRISAGIRWRDTPYEDLGADGRIDPRTLTSLLDDILPSERTIGVDSGNFMGYPAQFLSVPDEFGFCFTQSFQSVGLGLSTVLGAALARPDRMPVLGTGDGGFHMAVAELDTAVRLGLPLVCIVYNDAAYGAEIHHFGTKDPGADFGAVTFPETDFAALGRGFGADGVTVRGPADLEQVRNWVASAPTRPLVIDAKVVNDGGAWWLAEAFQGH